MKRLWMIVVFTAAFLGVGAAQAVTAEQTGNSALTAYSEIQAALAGDSIEGVQRGALRIVDAMKTCDCGGDEETVAAEVAVTAEAMKGPDLAALRTQFKALSRSVAKFVEVSGVPGVDLYYCPMVDAYWLQRSSDTPAHNPYYGKSMAKCGAKVERIED